MFTPQEIQEQTFSKAVFGGYDMQQVDDFLEPLTEDYITLYKENAVLKSKMKILVEKLEEYRTQEEGMKRAMANAQQTCDKMIAEAQAKCASMMNDAQGSVRSQTAGLQQTLAEEEERVNRAKQTAQNFISVVEQDIRGHLELLEKLKAMDLHVEEKPKQPVREKPYDWSKQEQPPMVVPSAPAPTPSASDIASEISENLEKLVGSEPAPTPRTAPAQSAPSASTPSGQKQNTRPLRMDSATIKFTDLQFGKNYDPTSV